MDEQPRTGGAAAARAAAREAAAAAPGALAVALGGLLALAGAMGIGRFLLTPALPMMTAGAGLGAAEAGLIAAANYAGYLLGAVAAGLLPQRRAAKSVLLAALAASALTSAGMALATGPLGWAAMRFAGGVASAVVLVNLSALVLGWLRVAGRSGLSALFFGGVGAGIALSALIAAPWVAGPADWAAVWLAGGALTAVLLAGAALLLPAAAAPTGGTGAGGAEARGLWRLIAAYGCLGFGYVILATFLVAMLREGASGRLAETLIWLAVGLAAAPSVALWSRVGRRRGVLWAFRLALLIEAAGVALGALASGTAALTIAAVALGGTFMGATALGLVEADRRAGGDGRRVMGLMTASFGTGQMIAPALAGWAREATGGYMWPGLAAAAVLLAGAWLAAGLERRDAARP
ncbi:MFS transporter [Paralimibaculum aggregatum]|uniref:MFS transporter n=1 Tax=Paralimibaculum aggregatum TaxID=3036245 RepID=A0ABQ6LNR1_9RHOB|nr:YbfB/YjiJ family MFS transporter [Limibaculum sp. NKW23]GMG82858.1 MFS transporter [Limibaculum sp. NKW23]